MLTDLLNDTLNSLESGVTDRTDDDDRDVPRDDVMEDSKNDEEVLDENIKQITFELQTIMDQYNINPVSRTSTSRHSRSIPRRSSL